MATTSLAGTAAGRTDRRTLLVEAATALFEQRAYDEVTTVEIAHRAGVAYGLIAHHFANKRGLYLATVEAVVRQIVAVHEVEPTGSTPAEQLRDALTRHVAFMEEHATGFLTLMRSGSGSDPDVHAMVERCRWQSASRLLTAMGVREPIRPALRTSLRGWVGYLDESILDYLDHLDLRRDDVVEMAISTLVATLHAVVDIDPRAGLKHGFIDLLQP